MDLLWIYCVLSLDLIRIYYGFNVDLLGFTKDLRGIAYELNRD
jgi:hypothetical protein